MKYLATLLLLLLLLTNIYNCIVLTAIVETQHVVQMSVQ